MIKIRRQIDQNWCEGELAGKVGIFPVNYVEVKQSFFVKFSALNHRSVFCKKIDHSASSEF